MTTRSWIRSLFALTAPRTNSRPPARRRPRVEALEDRTVPSTVTPTTFADGGAGSGSLRAAILAANADTGTDTHTINLDAGTYSLTLTNTGGQENAAATGDMDVTSTAHKLVIQGQGTTGPDATIVDATALLDRVIQVVNAGTEVELKDLLIKGGLAQDDGPAGAAAGTTTAEGGGILNNGGTLTLTNVVLDSNKAQGGTGQLALGGGLYSSGGSVTLTDATLSKNTAQGGNGSFGDGGDGGGGQGGGVYAGGSATVTLTNSTLSDGTAQGGVSGGGGGGGGWGQGGGLFNGATATLNNTIVANSASGGDVFNDTGATLQGGFNLIETAVAGEGTNLLTDTIMKDPMLGELADNGGPTMTREFATDSPAIDAGNSSLVPTGVTTDQRGFGRINRARVDVGAYELQPSLTRATLPDGAYGSAYTSQTLTATGGAGAPYTFTVTSGSLPAGLSLASVGTLSGTPTAAGASTFTITATDSGGFTASRDYSLTINQATPTVSVNPVRVLVFAAGDKAIEAMEAGCHVVGSDDLIERIANENFRDFDVAIATPDQMAKVGRIARILGTLGLMPNPKNGTVTFDVAQAVREFKAGKVDLVYGTALANSQLSGTATWTIDGNPVAVAGTFTYASDAGTVLGAGNRQSVAVTFTPDDGANYTTVSTTVFVNVAPATPTVSVNPVDLFYGTALANSQLSGTATWTVGGNPVTVPGTFTYASDAGTVLGTGDGQGVAVTFTPSDGTNYTTVSTIVTVNVTDVNEAPTVAVPAAQTAYEDVDLAITGISVGDSEGDSLRVTLKVSHGKLTLSPTRDVTVSGNGTGEVTLSGSAADLNLALGSLVYLGSPNYSGADTLSVTVNDGSLSADSSVAITVRSAAQQAADMQSLVNDLRDAGELNQGQANALSVKLNLKGNDGDVGKVQAFLAQVAAFRNAGILTPAEADALLELGNALLLSVTRR